jgi:DNA-binding transcriptional MocR family regulator
MTATGVAYAASYRQRSAMYVQVAGDLRTAIESGQHPPGSVLPSERQLAKRLGVSRDTVRDALRLLAGEGLVVKGAHAHEVSPTPVHEPLAVPGDAVVTARMPTPHERKALGIDDYAAMPVLIVHMSGQPDHLYAANRTSVTFDGCAPTDPADSIPG